MSVFAGFVSVWVTDETKFGPHLKTENFQKLSRKFWGGAKLILRSVYKLEPQGGGDGGSNATPTVLTPVLEYNQFCARFTLYRYEKLHQFALNVDRWCTLLSANLSANSLTMGTTR